MGVTALNVYAGLVGPLLITDQRERAMQISGVMPSGQYDVPLVLKDYWSEQKNSQTAKRIRIGRQGRGAAALHSRARPSSLISRFGPLLGAAPKSIAHWAGAVCALITR